MPEIPGTEMGRMWWQIYRPVTEDGKKRCAIAKTVHGYETRSAREYRAEKLGELKALFNSASVDSNSSEW